MPNFLSGDLKGDVVVPQVGVSLCLLFIGGICFTCVTFSSYGGCTVITILCLGSASEDLVNTIRDLVCWAVLLGGDGGGGLCVEGVCRPRQS